MCRKISASVDGGPSGGSHVRRPGSEDPDRRERKLFYANVVYRADWESNEIAFKIFKTMQ